MRPHDVFDARSKFYERLHELRIEMGAGLAQEFEKRELRQKIDGALALLSVEHRTVLILHEFQEMEYKEIAKTVGCSIGTVMSRLFYARRKMATLLAGLRKED